MLPGPHSSRSPDSKCCRKAQMLGFFFGILLLPGPMLLDKASITQNPGQRLWAESCCCFNVCPSQVSLLTPLTPPIINANYMFLSSPPSPFFQEKPFVPMHLELILPSCILSTSPASCPAASHQTPVDAIFTSCGGLNRCVFRLAPDERIQALSFPRYGISLYCFRSLKRWGQASECGI